MDFQELRVCCSWQCRRGIPLWWHCRSWSGGWFQGWFRGGGRKLLWSARSQSRQSKKALKQLIWGLNHETWLIHNMTVFKKSCGKNETFMSFLEVMYQLTINGHNYGSPKLYRTGITVSVISKSLLCQSTQARPKLSVPWIFLKIAPTMPTKLHILY